MLLKLFGPQTKPIFEESADTYQLLTIVVALDDTIVGDADGHHEHVCNGPKVQRVHHDGQHPCTCCRGLPAARTGALQVHFQKLLLTQQLLRILTRD